MKLIEKLSLYLPYGLKTEVRLGENNYTNEPLVRIETYGDSPASFFVGGKNIDVSKAYSFKPIVRHPDDLTEEEWQNFTDPFNAPDWIPSVFRKEVSIESVPFSLVMGAAKLHIWLWPEDFENGTVIRKQP